MDLDPQIFSLLTLAALLGIAMGAWALQRTVQQGFNELLKGMEEIVLALRRKDGG